MGLMPLPHEEVIKKINKVLQIRKEIDKKEKNREDCGLEKAYLQLQTYLNSNNNCSIAELDALISSLQRAVITLHKRKMIKTSKKIKKK